MKIVVSACLMGESCKYNGLDNYHRSVVEACERTGTEVLLVCPEVFGGLPTPRKPSEIVTGEVRTCEGVSVDREFRQVLSARSICASSLAAVRDRCLHLAGPQPLVRYGSHLRRHVQRYDHRGQWCFCRSAAAPRVPRDTRKRVRSQHAGTLSTALEPNTSSRVTVLASSVKLILSTTRSSKT